MRDNLKENQLHFPCFPLTCHPGLVDCCLMRGALSAAATLSSIDVYIQYIQNIARISNAVPCCSLLKDDNECWYCYSQVPEMYWVYLCSQVRWINLRHCSLNVFVFVFAFLLAPSGALVFIMCYYKHTKPSFPNFSNFEQSCLYTFMIHFHFHSVFDIQNRTR